MIIALPYSEARIFAHFGKSKTFVFYEIEEGNILKRYLADPIEGHAALSSFLIEHKTNVVLCSGIGDHMYNLLKDKNILVYPGVEGFTDDAVMDFLNGKIELDLTKLHKCSCKH